MNDQSSKLPPPGVPRTVAEALGQVVWLLSQCMRSVKAAVRLRRGALG